MKRCKGFTYIELAICLSAFSFIMVLLFGVLRTETKNNSEEINDLELNQVALTLNNKIGEMVNTHYPLELVDNALFTIVDGTPMCLMDFEVNRNNGLVNYKRIGSKFYVTDENDNMIAENILGLFVQTDRDDLIKISYTIELKGMTKSEEEVFLLSKIRY